MKNLTLGKKIGAGFAAVLGLLAILAWNAHRGQEQSYTNFVQYRELARDNNLAGRLQANMLTIRIDVKDYLITRSELDAKQCEEAKTKMLEFLGESKQQIQQPERARLIAEIETQFAEYDKAFNALVQLSRAANADKNQEESLVNTLNAIGPRIAKAAEDTKLSVKADQDALGPKVQAQTASALRFILWLSVIAIAVGIALAFFLTRSITRPIRLTIDQLSAGADQTASASAQISATSQSLAEGASEQAASLEETGASIEEMSSMTRRNAENADKANVLARQTRQAADDGADQMQAMSTAMNEIKTASDDIAKIIKTIDEIAFQTNILALNAAVEAARAGEAGMGFAVVADEVRSLAQRSAQAAKETAGKIEGAISKTTQGVAISQQVEAGLKDIVDKVRQVDALVAEVAAASKEQSQGIQQITTAVGQMDKVTQGNASSAEESAAAAEELNSQAVALKDAVGDLLKLVGGDARAATSASQMANAHIQNKPAVRVATPRNGHPAKNGSPRLSASRPAADLALTTASSREAIPLEGGFRDF